MDLPLERGTSQGSTRNKLTPAGRIP
jgi:hypothetical protein